MAGNLGNIFIRKRNFVTAVSGTDQVLQFLGGLQANLIQNLVHGDSGTCLGVDFAFYGSVGTDITVLIQNDCFRISGTDIASAKIFHYFSP